MGIARLIPHSLQLEAQAGRLGWRHNSEECAKLCARKSVFMQSERWGCQYSSAYLAAAIMWPK